VRYRAINLMRQATGVGRESPHDPLRPVANVGYLELKAIKTFLRSGPPSKARLIYLREMHDLRSTIT
jgi:hypothetical protein